MENRCSGGKSQSTVQERERSVYERVRAPFIRGRRRDVWTDGMLVRVLRLLWLNS